MRSVAPFLAPAIFFCFWFLRERGEGARVEKKKKAAEGIEVNDGRREIRVSNFFSRARASAESCSQRLDRDKRAP